MNIITEMLSASVRQQDFLGFIDQACTLLHYGSASTPMDEEAKAGRLAELAGLAERSGCHPVSLVATHAVSLLRLRVPRTDLQESILQACQEWCRSAIQLLLLKNSGTVYPPLFEETLLTRYSWLEQHTTLNGMTTASLQSTRLSLLIVDDEEMIRFFLEDILSTLPVTIVHAEDGRQAIKLIHERPFDIIFTDINMPVVNGMEVLKAAKERHPDTEVVVMTGYTSIENATEAIRHGAYGYLDKPFSHPEDIVHLVERMGRSIRLKEQNKNLLLELQLRNSDLERSLSSLSAALESIREKQKALIHADRMVSLGTLTAGVAHEINNPLTFIRGHAQTLEKSWKSLAPLLAEGDSTEDAPSSVLQFARHEYSSIIAGILDGTDRIRTIVRNLQDFAHPESNDTELTPTTLKECADRVLSLLGRSTLAGIAVSLDFVSAPPLSLNTRQIEQVLINLLINAVQALSGCSNPRIVLTGRLTPEGQSLEVMDNGCGMDQATQKKVFMPFFTTKTANQGTGLGLSIAQSIMTNHGGDIEVLSTPHTGTTFTLRFPSSGIKDDHSTSFRVLVVDDEQNVRLLVETILRNERNYQVDTASGGVEALHKIHHIQPDLLLLDLRMCDMDGLDMLNALAANPPQKWPKILLLTGMGPALTDRHIHDFHIAGVIRKTFSPASLVEEINKVLFGHVTPTPSLGATRPQGSA